ncbi:hypothetical protein J2X20_004553 [Pelomonas saccharophila]|uniref:Uncharacterized protein n=1 Tax=Roseateles saccharophilus TaxID=304 RepID=A0ABU1YSP8_ROSSA|nr:hypothetical protein [Roseateles saccharophilus]MDR7271885.1 hypothetical protein [Roseateles saccharophilus]
MMFSVSYPTSRARRAALIAHGLAVLLAWMLLMAAFSVPTAAAAASAVDAMAAFELPARPSEMLSAPQERWKPVLAQAGKALDETPAADKSALMGLHIQRTVLLQAQQAWPEVLEAVQKTRQLQGSEAGRQTAGLLNEVLARQALKGGDAAWLRQHLRDQVLAMPWADVEPAIRALRQQLGIMTAEGVRQFVVSKMDASVTLAQNKASLGFVMQLLALRFQLLEVLPRRDLLIEALDEAIAQHSGAAAR